MKDRFKKFTTSEKSLEKSLENSTELKPLKSFLKNHCLWSYDKQPIARGIAAGLAGAVIPGFQIFYAAILVVLLRGNLPIALLCTLVTNPFTVVPISYFIYFIGTLIIRNGNTEFIPPSFHWDFSSFSGLWLELSTWILQFGKAFFIGLPIASLSLGILGYFGTIIIWDMSVLLFKDKK